MLFRRFLAVNGRQSAFLLRVWNTAVFWTWIFHAFRIASGVLLLPLLMRFLPAQDLGMYTNFLALTGFQLSLESMFATTVTRVIGFALRGVSDIPAIGITLATEGNLPPNTKLLGQILGATRRLYRYLTLFIALLLALGGTLWLLPLFPQTSNSSHASAAWAIMICSACLELYTGYWLVFLRGLNKVVLSARLSAIVYGTKFLLSCALLVFHFGLLAVPIAGLVTGLMQRLLARGLTLKNLPAGTFMDFSQTGQLLRVFWPNSWRLGLVFLSANVMNAGFSGLISRKLGLVATYRYGFSYQIIAGICANMAGVWTMVKWPAVVQLRAINDQRGIQALLRPRIWLQTLSYAFFVTGFLIVGPPLLAWIAPGKELMPMRWLVLLAVATLFDAHYSFWTTLLSTENRIPSLWAAVITNLTSLAVAYTLLLFTNLGLGAFVVAPLICGGLFNYWYWAKEGARNIGTTWFGYVFSR